MNRQEFKARTIRLVGQVQLDSAMRLLPNLPIDPDKPLELIIREEKKVRGLDANAYYWVRIGEISEQAWFSGKQFNSDTWHEYAKRNIMPETVTIKGGDVVSKWVESPDGALHVMSTTVLEKKCFAEYVTAVEAFGSGIGVIFSAKGWRNA